MISYLRFRQATRLATQEMTGALLWSIIIAVTGLCVLSGPFGTIDTRPVGFRLIYWGMIVTSTALLGLWFNALIRSQGWKGWQKFSQVSVAFSLCASGLVLLLNLTILSPFPDAPSTITAFGYSFPSAALIFLLSVYADKRIVFLPTSSDNVVPALMKRLEKHAMAKQILALSAQDHYVEVITDNGSELCLMRLKDAIDEAAPQEGFQIHRSHWVARSAIASTELKADRANVRLVNGRTLAISQSRLKEFERFRFG